MTRIKLAVTAFLSLALFIMSVSASQAYEGTAEVRSLTGEDYRCFAAVLQMQNLKYTIPVSCRNLIYPADNNIYSYVMWAVPQDGSDHRNLGVLGFGKALFEMDKPTTTLYVTTEADARVRKPNGPVVMQGSVDRLRFLDALTTPTPRPEGSQVEPEDTIIEQQPLSTRDKLVMGLQRAGIVSLAALVAIIGLVFVITRARG